MQLQDLIGWALDVAGAAVLLIVGLLVWAFFGLGIATALAKLAALFAIEAGFHMADSKGLSVGAVILIVLVVLFLLAVGVVLLGVGAFHWAENVVATHSQIP